MLCMFSALWLENSTGGSTATSQVQSAGPQSAKATTHLSKVQVIKKPHNPTPPKHTHTTCHWNCKRDKKGRTQWTELDRGFEATPTQKYVRKCSNYNTHRDNSALPPPHAWVLFFNIARGRSASLPPTAGPLWAPLLHKYLSVPSEKTQPRREGRRGARSTLWHTIATLSAAFFADLLFWCVCEPSHRHSTRTVQL